MPQKKRKQTTLIFKNMNNRWDEGSTSKTRDNAQLLIRAIDINTKTFKIQT